MRRIAVVGVLALTGFVVGTSSAAATPVTLDADTEARDALRVLRYVPEEYRHTCDTWLSEQIFRGIAAQGEALRGAVVCHPTPEITAYFTQYASVEAMDAAYDSYIVSSNFGEFPPDSDCGGDGTYDVRGETVGRWACYTIDPAQLAPATGVAQAVELNWTDDRSAILGNAVRVDGDAEGLNEWWSGSDAGPLSKPTSTGIPSPLTAAHQQIVARRLLRLVPKDFRATCETRDVNDRSSVSTAEFQSRLFVRAVVKCVPPVGADSVSYYAFVDSAHADGFMTKYIEGVDFGSGSCPVTGTYGVGRRRNVGSYSCWLYGDPQAAAVIWSNDDLAVVGLAVRSDADGSELLEWWEESGGPVT